LIVLTLSGSVEFLTKSFDFYLDTIYFTSNFLKLSIGFRALILQLLDLRLDFLESLSSRQRFLKHINLIDKFLLLVHTK